MDLLEPLGASLRVCFKVWPGALRIRPSTARPKGLQESPKTGFQDCLATPGGFLGGATRLPGSSLVRCHSRLWLSFSRAES
eukprot:8722660-Pyramimonas_sp.AAC.2